MAYAGPTIQTIGTTYTGVAATSHGVPYPSGLTNGDIIVLLAFSSHHDETFTIGSGWRLVTAYNTGITEGVAHEILIKASDGTETGNYALSTPGSKGSIVAKMYRVSPGGSTLADYATGATAAFDLLAADFDPPNRTLPATDDWIAFATMCANGTTNISVWPTGYTNQFEGDYGGITVGICTLTHEAVSAVNPSTFTASSNESGVAYTTCVRESDLVLETVVRPVEDIFDDGWDSAPTASQDLWAQVDEETASDTDYIYTTDPNP